MKTEQRTSIRRRIPFNVLINYDLAYSKRWKICDLSLSGVLVETAQADLPLGAQVPGLRQSGLYRAGEPAVQHLTRDAPVLFPVINFSARGGIDGPRQEKIVA